MSDSTQQPIAPKPNAPSDQSTGAANRQVPQPSRKTLHWWLNKLLMPVMIIVAGMLVIVAMGLAQRIGWISAGDGTATVESSAADQVFTCPMHPQIRQPTAGRCPICGMALVVATAGGADLDELSVRIEPAQRRLAGIETAKASRQPVFATIQTVGAIAIDESRMATIASYVEGRLERLFADYTGVDVAKGVHLADIYSPDLYKAQVEYVETRKSVRKMTSSSLATVREAQTRLAKNSRQRLVELGMTDEQLAELDDSETAKARLTIHAPIGGTVIEKLAVEGKYVKAGEPIYRIADLSTVWLMLELYPEDAARIRYGQRVEAEMQSLPGELFNGRIAFIDPRVEANKRTVGVRVEFLNNDGALRPGDYANATIYLPIGEQGEVYDSELAGRWISPMHPQIISDTPGVCTICGMDLVPTSQFGYSDKPVEQPTSLYVPRSALLMAGSSSVVYVEITPGRFEIRSVVLGPILRDKVVILGGLKEGELVATAGNFLIDSQMQLAGKPSLIDPTRAIVAQRERKIPLEFTEVQVTAVTGEAGNELEAMFATYFSIQQTLASDKKPSMSDATALHQLAMTLESNPDLPNDARTHLTTVAKHSEHLHHLDLDKARHEAFRPISHAVVSLATIVRSATARQSFHHMFCPMVEGGAGDWLQPTSDLVNPYKGREMLRCGEIIHEFSANGHRPEDSASKPHDDDAPNSHKHSGT
ncbi:MAG: efflux RND transporter periplasmic adaptor subunit [Planctomycetes bacterium]|nr:efflux RND transporter periplasmic adaptor subunit [Planctomycetota bacterium]